MNSDPNFSAAQLFDTDLTVPQQTTGAYHTPNTPLFLKEKGSARGGVYGSVRMGTENYGESAPQQTACVCNTQNTPLFLKEKGSARGKENFFSREKKLSFPLVSSPFTLIELLVSATC